MTELGTDCSTGHVSTTLLQAHTMFTYSFYTYALENVKIFFKTAFRESALSFRTSIVLLEKVIFDRQEQVPSTDMT